MPESTVWFVFGALIYVRGHAHGLRRSFHEDVYVSMAAGSARSPSTSCFLASSFSWSRWVLLLHHSRNYQEIIAK